MQQTKLYSIEWNDLTLYSVFWYYHCIFLNENMGLLLILLFSVVTLCGINITWRAVMC